MRRESGLPRRRGQLCAGMEGRDGPAEEAALCGHILFGGRGAAASVLQLHRRRGGTAVGRPWEQDTAGSLSCRRRRRICPVLCLSRCSTCPRGATAPTPAPPFKIFFISRVWLSRALRGVASASCYLTSTQLNLSGASFCGHASSPVRDGRFSHSAAVQRCDVGTMQCPHELNPWRRFDLHAR